MITRSMRKTTDYTATYHSSAVLNGHANVMATRINLGASCFVDKIIKMKTKMFENFCTDIIQTIKYLALESCQAAD